MRKQTGSRVAPHRPDHRRVTGAVFGIVLVLAIAIPAVAAPEAAYRGAHAQPGVVQPTALSLGPGLGVPAESPAADGGRGPCDCAVRAANHDDSFENGYAWGGAGVVSPSYGAFAECFTGPQDVCGIDFRFTQTGGDTGQTMDVFIWDDAGGSPGNVIAAYTGIDPGPIAVWPGISTHTVPTGSISLSAGTWWVGYWGDWPGAAPGWYVAADENGTGRCPRTNIAPGTGFPTGWQDVAVVFPNAKALGIELWVSPGQVHNQVLSYVEQNNPLPPDPGRITETELRSLLEVIREYLQANGFAPPTVEASIQELAAQDFLYNDEGDTYVGAPVVTDSLTARITEYLVGQGRISSSLAAALRTVADLVRDRAGLPAVLAYLDVLESGVWSPDDRSALCVFADQFRRSAEYWGGQRTPEEDKTDTVILADAAGALIGLLGTPAGSVVLGAAVSIWANHATSVAADRDLLDFGGRPNNALAYSSLDVQMAELVVWDIDAVGQCGVSFPIDPSESSLGFTVANLDSLVGGPPPVGAALSTTLLGEIGGVPDQPLVVCRTERITNGWATAFDFTALGTTIQNVSIYDDGVSVAYYPAVENAVFRTPWPGDRFGSNWCCYWYIPCPECGWTVGWPIEMSITVNDFAPVYGDSVVVEPVNVLQEPDLISGMNVETDQLQYIVLNHLPPLQDPAEVEPVEPQALDGSLSVGPNPFRDHTTVRFALPSEAHTRLSVFDVHGRLVRGLLDESLAAGEHMLDLDAGERHAPLKAGVYFLKLESSGVQWTKPLAVIR